MKLLTGTLLAIAASTSQASELNCQFFADALKTAQGDMIAYTQKNYDVCVANNAQIEAEKAASAKAYADEQAAAEAKKQHDLEVGIAADKIQAAKPGVRIGMTAKQVINNTNWGKPSSINRTVTSHTVTEQWVYNAGPNYLYFKNGVLVAVQN